MKSEILIIVNSDNKNLIYIEAVKSAKAEIQKYFGTRYCIEDDPEIPAVMLKCEVTQDDIDTIKKVFDSNDIRIVAIIGAEESDRVEEDIINLL